MYTYWQILKQAFKIATRKPSVWFFGFFVALLGSAGEFEIFVGSTGTGISGLLAPYFNGLAEAGLFSAHGLQTFAASFLVNPLSVFIFILFSLIVFALSVLVIWLIIVSQGALTSQVFVQSRGREISFADSFKVGISKFFPLLGVNFVFRALSWGAFVVAALFSLINISKILSFGIYFFNVIFVLLVLFSISFVSRYAILGIILKEWKFKESLVNGWKLFTRNWLLSLEVSFILFAIYIVINSALLFFLGGIMLVALNYFRGFVFGIALVYLILFTIFVVAEIILSIFHWTVWTLVFELIGSQKEALKSFLKRTISKLLS